MRLEAGVGDLLPLAAGQVCGCLVAFDDNATFGTWSRGIDGQLWGNHVYLPLVMS